MNQRSQSRFIHRAAIAPQVDLAPLLPDLYIYVTPVHQCVVPLCVAGKQISAAAVEVISDDAVFRDKLKLMGKCEFAFTPSLLFYRCLLGL